MVGWGELDLDVEGLHNVLVQVGNEGVPIVTDGHMRDTIPGGPFQEGPTAFLRGCSPQWITLNPSRSPAQDTKEIFEASGGRERAYNIKMNGRESLIWHGEPSHSSLDSPGLFATLARMTCRTEVFNVFPHSGPVILLRSSSESLLRRRVILVMEKVEDKTSVLGRKERSGVLRISHLAEHRMTGNVNI